MSYQLLLALHLASVILLLGVGGGSAFYKFMADRSKNLELILHTNKLVVLADWLFTTPAVIAQPLTGYWLVELMGYSFNLFWLKVSVLLYAFSIVLWLVAVWLQMSMKNIAIEAKKENRLLDDNYYGLVKYWSLLGVFSALAMGVVFYLMIYKNFNL